MFRALPLLLALAATSARAQPWVDLGPSLGLPSQLAGPSGPSLSAGITAADLDGDGRLELITSTPTLGLTAYSRVGATYTVDQTLLPVSGGGGLVFGHTLFDADGDGDLDLFVARDDRDRLYLFDSATRAFVDTTETHLPRLFGWSATATAVDLDGDGDLDLLLARYIDRVDFPAHRCFANRVYTNDGRGVFTDATPPALSSTRGCSFVIVAADHDDDLDLDLIAVNDFTQFTGRQELWENRGLTQDGAFDLVEVSAARELVAPLYGMGAAYDDLDQDGQPELMLTSIGEPLLFSRTPDGRFRIVNTDKNIYSRFAWDRHQATWTTRFLDLDADGHLDVLSAGGALPAAPFIGNPPDQGAVILRGRPDGGLEPLPVALDLPRAGHTSRDFELADLTGDGVDELLAVHVHGRISVFENLDLQGNRTRITLRPSTTGENAAGARVSLTCSGVTRTRRVNAGGDYGVYDRPRVELSFPAPCASGQPATGVVRWPSGLVQTFATTIGATLNLVEPAWFTLTPDPSQPRRGTVTLDLSPHTEPFDLVELIPHGVELSPLTEVSPKRFTATWQLLEPTPDPLAPLTDPDTGRLLAVADARVDLRVDGATWGFHPRIPGTSPELSLSAAPVAGRTIRVRLAFADPLWSGLAPPAEATVTLGATAPIQATLTPFEPGLLVGALALPATPGRRQLVVSWDGGRLERSLDVLPTVMASDSELVVRELHILEAERLTRRVRMRARLYDANHESSSVTLDSLGLLLDGVPVEPDLRAIEAGFMTLGLEHSRLEDGSELTLTIAGVPYFSPQRVAQVDQPERFGALASPERSRCWFSEPQGRADGEDVMTALMHFSDEGGARLPDTGLTPTLSAQGLRVSPSSLELGYGGWRVDLVAGDAPGWATLSASLPGMEESISCGLALVEPPLLPAPITSSAMISLTANPVVGQSMTVRMWPLGPDGRSLGSGVPLTLETSENAEATPVLYIGQGRYEALVVPRAPGPVVLQVKREDGAIIASTTLWETGVGPDAEPEPGPEVVEDDAEPEPSEPGPELVEDDAEPGPEPSEPDPEQVERDAEPGPEATEPDPEIPELAEPLDTSPSPDPDPDPASPESEPETQRPRDEGSCASAGQGAPLLLAVLSLLGLSRRRRPW